nr:uncharacterized protein LOC109167327 [Ipomoea batatas]
MKYLIYHYKTVHRLDSTEFFVNARLKGDEIISKVDGTDVIIVHGDISVLFDFPVKEGALPNCFGHDFNQEDLWKEVNGGQASVELKLTLKKMVLQPENERAIDILSRIVENRSKGVKLRDGVATHHNAYLLRMKPHALKGKGATPTKKKATKEKSSSNFPLAEIAKKAKRKLEWWKIVNLRKLRKPPQVEPTTQEEVETTVWAAIEKEVATSQGVHISVTVRALLIPQEPALAADVEGENLTKVVSKIAKEVGGNVVEITEDSEATLYDPTAQQIRVDAQLA